RRAITSLQVGCPADRLIVRAWRLVGVRAIHTDCRVGTVVELEHDLPQLHPPSIFQIGCGESSLFFISNVAPRVPAEPVARGASRTSFGCAIPNPNFVERYVGSNSCVLPVDAPLRAFAAIFSGRLSAGVCRRIGALLRSRVLRARARNEEQLRNSLQRAVFQRWIPRGASLVAGRTLVAVARPYHSGCGDKPLACSASVDGGGESGRDARARGIAIVSAPGVCADDARTSLAPTSPEVATCPDGTDRGWGHGSADSDSSPAAF